MSDNLAQILRRLWELLASFLATLWKWLTGRQNEEHAEHELEYFLPGEVILHFEHPIGFTQEQLATAIGSFLIQQDSDRPWKSLLTPPKPEEILIFPLQNDAGSLLSIAPVRLKNEKASQEDLVQLLLTINTALSQGPMTILGALTLNSVAPDWLISNASHGIPPPTPGSWPVEEEDIPKEADWKFQLRDKQTTSPLPFAAEKGEKIHVAILDTSPTATHLDEAYEKWRSNHGLLESLWGPNRKLDLHTKIDGELELTDYSVVGHGYFMPDHGLYAAGIINTIAPEARLHLVKIFTSYGCSSMKTITQGIIEVLRNPEIGRPLIVNCSFGLSKDDKSHLPEEIHKMVTALQGIFDRLTKEKDILVVAAAGNKIEDVGRHPASYPAAFDKVIGVGALSKQSSTTTRESYEAATYSNLADDPPSDGYMVFGGEPGRRKGVLGIYTTELPVYAEGCLSFLLRIFTGRGLGGWAGPGHLPPRPRALTIDYIRYERNNTGWAWWAGTSFAAPVISGILANWWSQQVSAKVPVTLDEARQALNDLSQTTTTDKNEKVIFVMQG